MNDSQGTNQPLDEPSGKQQDAVSGKKDEAEEVLAKRDPNDHSGEPMHVHDGSDKKESSTATDGSEKDTDKLNEEKGTGEKYVRSSGLYGSGGDFDGEYNITSHECS